MNSRRRDGYAVILVLSLIVLLGIIFSTYALISRTEVASSRNNARSSAGFYAAEAALNARTEQVRAKFNTYLVPVGTSPSSTNPCVGSNLGSGDFACQSVVVNGRTTVTYVIQGTQQWIKIGAGELYANLNAQETTYNVYGRALNAAGNPEAIAQLTFRSRVVPLFQFAVFFNKDLEFSNTANLDLAGPVYSAGNIFLDAGSGATLGIHGQVLTPQTLYRGRKDVNYCDGTVNVDNAGGTATAVACSGIRTALTDLSPWGGQMQQGIAPVAVPDVSTLQPTPTSTYWNQADLRLVLRLNTAGLWLPEIEDVNGNVNSSATSQLSSLCPTAVTSSNTFFDRRENIYWRNINPSRSTKVLMDVDTNALINCIASNSSSLGVTGLAGNSSDKGLVIYMTLKDDNGSNISQGNNANNYGVRLRNGANLHATSNSRSDLGVTIVTDQAVFINGNYNVSNKVPASILADSANILSSNWGGTSTNCSGFSGNVTVTGDQKSNQSLACRPAASTTVQAAILAGTDTSGVNNGQPATEGLLDTGLSSGGVHNMMRFHEEWGANGGLPSPIPYNYVGSLVSLGRPLHSRGNLVVGSGTVSSTDSFKPYIYNPPQRRWQYDVTFNDAAKLPPLSPRFVYIRQDNFVRNFQQ